LLQHPALPWVGPFLFFILLLMGRSYLGQLGEWDYAVRVLLTGAAIWIFSRRVLDFRIRFFLPSLLLGVATFLLWIAPDTLFPGWREHWLFTNSLTGAAKVSLTDAQLQSNILLFFRMVSMAVMVPILEELFWRGWMMRWLIKPEFEEVPLGTFELRALLITAVLFALEHGPYWEVGLLTGLLWNWYMTKTKSLGDLIFVHAITNLALGLYVIYSKQWQYLM
jgi:uncharacterized protein